MQLDNVSGSRWASNLDQLGDSLVEISTDGILTGSEFRKARISKVLPAYQTIFSLARWKSKREVSTFYDAVNVLTQGRVNGADKNPLPRRGPTKRWNEEEIQEALQAFVGSWECIKSGGSSYYYVKWHDMQEPGKYPSASTISARYGQFSDAISPVIEKFRMSEKVQDVIALIRNSDSDEEAFTKLQEEWKMTPDQASLVIEKVNGQ